MKKLFDSILWWFMSGMLGVRKSASKGTVPLMVVAALTIVLTVVVAAVAG